MTLSTQKEHQTTLPKPLAAIYVRVSTEEQALHGFSLKAQEDALKNYAQALGYEISEIYRDEGKSAKDLNRPSLIKLLSDAENKRVTAIFIYKLDRFSRSLKDLILTIDKLKEWNIDFISMQDKIETASASGKLMFHIISAFAEFERNIIGERTSFGMMRKMEEGGSVTKPPFGYMMIDKKLEPDPKKEGLVQKIFEEFSTTNISLNKLAKKNNLTVNGLKKVLSNRTYVGEVKFAGKTRLGTHQPVVTAQLFERVQELLRNKRLRDY